jgi:hypothetical protein
MKLDAQVQEKEILELLERIKIMEEEVRDQADRISKLEREVLPLIMK